MMCYAFAPLYDIGKAAKAAEFRCPQILRERFSSNPKVMQKRLTAYLLLADLCDGILPQIFWTDQGKPFFTDYPGYCSLSHTETGAVAVVADHPIGIDLQQRILCTDRLSARVCTPTELDYLQGQTSCLERDRSFTRIWNAKEAAVKVNGIGLSKIGFQNIEVASDFTKAWVKTAKYSLEWVNVDLPDTTCCIAFQE